MGFAVPAAQFLTCSHLRALPELQAPELGACVFTALTRPCVTFHTLPTFPASHHPSPVFPPLFGPVWDVHRGCRTCWSLSWGHPPGWPWKGGISTPPHTGTWSSRGQVLGTAAGGAAPGCAGDTGGEYQPCCRGCPGRAVLSHRCSGAQRVRSGGSAPPSTGISGCAAVDELPWSGWVWGLFAIELPSPCSWRCPFLPGCARVLWGCCRCRGAVPKCCSSQSSPGWRHDPRWCLPVPHPELPRLGYSSR